MLADTLTHIHDILSAASERGIGLRLVGSIAVMLRCPSRYEQRVGQNWVPGDIDFVCSQKESLSLGDIFIGFGYENDRGIMVATEGRRWSLSCRNRKQSIDVFFDRMEFCHTLDLRGRIPIDAETITLADLFLSKIQYVSPREDDLDDLLAILVTYPFGTADGDIINIDRIGCVLSKSWGFYYTANLNFKRIEERLQRDNSSPSSLLRREKLVFLRDFVENQPKGKWWRLRGLIGTRIKWYNDVEGAEAF